MAPDLNNLTSHVDELKDSISFVGGSLSELTSQWNRLRTRLDSASSEEPPIFRREVVPCSRREVVPCSRREIVPCSRREVVPCSRPPSTILRPLQTSRDPANHFYHLLEVNSPIGMASDLSAFSRDFQNLSGKLHQQLLCTDIRSMLNFPNCNLIYNFLCYRQ